MAPVLELDVLEPFGVLELVVEEEDEGELSELELDAESLVTDAVEAGFLLSARLSVR